MLLVHVKKHGKSNPKQNFSEAGIIEEEKS